MKRLQFVARRATWLSLAGLIMFPPWQARAEQRTGSNPAPAVVDVALDANQLLHGQLLDGSAVPAKGHVTLLKGGQLLAAADAADDGNFALRVPQGGTYQLATADSTTTIRVWTQCAAPPHSQQRMVLVQGGVLRGQQGAMPFSSISPWVIAGVVAAAIGVPIILIRQTRRPGRWKLTPRKE